MNSSSALIPHSHKYSHKEPQALWPKTTHIHSLIVLEVRSAKEVLQG